MKNSVNKFFKVFTVIIITTFLVSCNNEGDDTIHHDEGEMMEHDGTVHDDHAHGDEVPADHMHDDDMHYDHDHQEAHSEEHMMEDTASMQMRN